MLKKSEISLPFHFFPASFLAIIAVSLLSSFFSSSPITSLLGYGFETDTVIFLLLSFFYIYLISVLFKTREKIFYSYLVFFGSLFILGFFHLARLVFGTDFLSFGLYANIFSSPLGKWNEVGAFFGLGALLSLVTLEMAHLSRLFKALFYIAFGMSLLFLAVINFALIWVILGIFSLVFFVYLLASSSWKKTSEDSTIVAPRKISWIALAVLLFSLAFILAGGFIGDYMSSVIGATSFEVRPSLSATLDVAKNTFKQNILLGAGPNRFLSQWLLFKPLGINNTTFWNTTFNYGIGIVPTSLVTGGMLGFLAWLSFLGLFLYVGFKSIFSKVRDEFSQYLIASSFLASLYLWIIMMFYVPGITLVALALFFTGLFLSAILQENIIPLKKISFSNPRTSFVSILVSVFLLVGLLSYAYVIVRHGVASAFFERGVVAYTVEGNLDAAENKVRTALRVEQNDIYYRAMSELNRVRMNEIVSRTDASAESIRADFQRVFASALDNAQSAVNFNQSNYQNWLALGRVYQIAVAAGIEKERAYELASNAYLEALNRSPQDPSLYLELARLEINNTDNKKAREYITQALILKQNYTEAIFLLSQIEVSEGNLNGAISSVEGAAALDPNNPTVYFRLGLLKYNKKDYKGAAGAFEQAVALNSIYANAKYFLGLSYYELNRRDDAIQQFEDIQTNNPGNQEIQFILNNLKNRRAPFANVTPPLDDEPESRDSLPVGEE